MKVVSMADGPVVIFKIEETHQSYILGDVHILPRDCKKSICRILPASCKPYQLFLGKATKSAPYRSRNSDGFPANTFCKSVPQKCAPLMSRNAQFNGLPLALVFSDVSNVFDVRNASSECMIENNLLALVVRRASSLTLMSVTTSRLR